MGRSRGGLTTKIHALVNGRGLPLAFHITAGQVHDAPACQPLLVHLCEGQTLLADKAYDADWIRKEVARQGAKANIPSKSNRRNPFDFNVELYKKRNQIERFFGRIKRSFRAIATRYDKFSTHFMAMIKIAAIRLWCEFYESAT